MRIGPSCTHRTIGCICGVVNCRSVIAAEKQIHRRGPWQVSEAGVTSFNYLIAKKSYLTAVPMRSPTAIAWRRVNHT